MECYLDNSATTRAFDEVRALMNEVMDKDYGNPSSLHMIGVNAENYIKYAKKVFAKNLKVNEKEIYFTSGGTESDNMVLIGCADANKRRGKHIITTNVEHPAILQTTEYLEKLGYRVTYLHVDNTGRVDVSELKEALCEDTILVSVMYVNNEIGSHMPIEEIGSIIKAYNKDIIFHVDAVQGFGKYRINPKREKIDALSISGHKIHGPKGIGVLYVNEKVKINPIIFGGSQQSGLRSGTENVPAIAGMAKATELLYNDFDSKMDKLYELKEYFVKELSKLECVTINGLADEDIRKTAPHIVSASFAGIRAEVMLHALEEKGVYVSSGSACASNKPSVSFTLKAIGVKQELLDCTIRFSFSVETTREQLDYTMDCLKELIPVLSRYSRK